jgi:hypothetical protein
VRLVIDDEYSMSRRSAFARRGQTRAAIWAR